MIALAVGFAWLGYSYGLYGWCLIKGYDVTLHELMDPRGGGYLNTHSWPPPLIPPTQVFPSAGARATGSQGSQPGLA